MELAEVVARIHANRDLPTPRIRRSIRLRAGLSQQDIAELLDVSRVAVSRWEDGSRKPNRRNVRRYVEVLEALDEAAS